MQSASHSDRRRSDDWESFAFRAKRKSDDIQLSKPKIMTHSTNYSDNWKFTNWGELQKVTFRLQRRIFKAVKTGDEARARRLQKLVLTSYAARMLAIRQVTQLNAGKKTAGIDGKKSLTFEERFQLENVLKKQVKNWKHQGLREIPIPKKGGKSPFDGDINYWAKRNNFLYDGTLAKILKKQNHSCRQCKNKIIDDEKVELHHIDGNHNNWDEKNLLGIHRSCHQYIHQSKS